MKLQLGGRIVRAYWHWGYRLWGLQLSMPYAPPGVPYAVYSFGALRVSLSRV